MEHYSKYYQKVTKLGIQSTNELLVYLKNHFLEGNKATINIVTVLLIGMPLATDMHKGTFVTLKSISTSDAHVAMLFFLLLCSLNELCCLLILLRQIVENLIASVSRSMCNCREVGVGRRFGRDWRRFHG